MALDVVESGQLEVIPGVTKRCSKCGGVKPVGEFEISLGKNGLEYLRKKCLDCRREEKRIAMISYNNRLDIKEKRKEYHKNTYIKHPRKRATREQILERQRKASKKWRESPKGKEKKKELYEKNKEKIRILEKKRRENWKKTDIEGFRKYNREQVRRYRATPKGKKYAIAYRLSHKDEIAARATIYRMNHLDEFAAKENIRRISSRLGVRLSRYDISDETFKSLVCLKKLERAKRAYKSSKAERLALANMNAEVSK